MFLETAITGLFLAALEGSPPFFFGRSPYHNFCNGPVLPEIIAALAPTSWEIHTPRFSKGAQNGLRINCRATCVPKALERAKKDFYDMRLSRMRMQQAGDGDSVELPTKAQIRATVYI